MRFYQNCFFLLLAFVIVELAHGHIFLDPNGVNTWSGNCLETACASNTPCKPKSFNTVSGCCELVFLNTSWDSTQFTFQSSLDQPIYIYVHSEGSYKMISWAFYAPVLSFRPYSFLLNGEPDVVVASPIALENSYLKFKSMTSNSNLTVEGVAISSGARIALDRWVAGYNFITVDLKRIFYEASSVSEGFDFLNPGDIQRLRFIDCIFNVTSEPAASAIHLHASNRTIDQLWFLNSVFSGTNLFDLTVNVTQLVVQDSILAFTGPLFQIEQPLIFAARGSTLQGTNTATYPTIIRGMSSFDASIMSLADSNLQYLSLPSTSTLDITSSNLVDISLNTRAEIRWNNVTAVLTLIGSSITIHGSGVVFDRYISMIDCRIDSGPGNIGMFILDAFLLFTPQSSLQVTWLSVGSSIADTVVAFSNLTVSKGIQGILSTKHTTIQALPNSTWTWSSFAVSDTIYSDLANVQTFNYIATIPQVGITKSGSTKPADYFPVHLQLPSNITINLIWRPLANQIPAEGTFYRICQLGDFVITGESVSIPSSTPIDPYLPQFRVEINANGTLGAWLTPPVSPACPPLPYPAGFDCVNGALFAAGDITGGTISLPPNVGVVYVNGSFQTSSNLVFEGLGTSLNVSGCVTYGTEGILIDLSKDAPSKGSSTVNGQEILLISQGLNCDSVSLVNIKVSSPKGCKTFVAKPGPSSTSSRLTVLFSLDDGKCKTKWIILGSALGGAIVIAVIAIALLVTFNRSAREFFRPHTKRKRVQNYTTSDS